MATVTGVTAERLQEVEDAALVSASIVGTDLVFQTGSTPPTTINAGKVVQPAINAWPVGSIFMNVTATSPASLLGGGTWARWGQGRMPISLDEGQTEFASPQATGGEKAHVLSNAEMPSHSHGGATGLQSADHTHTGYAAPNGNHNHSIAHVHNMAHTHTTPNHTHPDIEVSGNWLEWGNNTRAAGSGAGIVADVSGGTNVTVGSGGGGTTGGSSATNTGGAIGSTSGDAGNHDHTVSTNGVSANHNHAIPADGGSAAHNNMPPYITVYMWRRTA